MGKKINSTHMKNILDNFSQFEEFKIIIFSEEIIFKTQIEDWPIVDALIIFFSDGFPYNKGLKYINLRKPYLVNDFEMQKVFWDRVKVLKMLEEENIPIPSHIIVDRGGEINNDGENNSGELNTSAEKEKKVENYKLEINKLIKNENKVNNLKLNIRKTNSNLTKKKELFKKDDEKEKNKKNKSINYIDKSISSNNSSLNRNNNIKEKESTSNKDELIEFDDHIEYKGKKLYKPFVEKPFNGDDHNIYIYYPPNLGGGHKRLFRKTKELSSLYFPNLNEIRRDKSYIYEEFLQSDGFDIKVYTIGPGNFHAEARKSPTLDGKVNRSAEGKEVRIPINLTVKEKEIARKIVLKFKQNICGFDILRCKGNSFVCDVNGFSFVKGNKNYYNNCTYFLRKNIKQGLKLESFEKTSNKNNPIFRNLTLNQKLVNSAYQKQEELKSIIAVFRHADRSPKEKMKLIVDNEQFLSLFDEFCKKNNKKKEIKLKKPKELLRVLEIVNDILEKNKDKLITIGSDNFFTKIFQIKMVLEQKINFDGLTRKIQMKPLKFKEIVDEKGNKICKITQALMILKWGGNLTHAGIEQARKLGTTFLCRLYPTYQDETCGLLKLHSTYRHDLKCYSADEGRCLKTAASFLKGLLQLDGPIIPIISSMVRTDEDVNKLLDDSESIQEFKGKIKQKLNECLNYDGELKDKFYSLFAKESIYPKEENNDNDKSKSLDEEDDLESENNDNIESIKNIENFEDNKGSSEDSSSEGFKNYNSCNNICTVCNNKNCFNMDNNDMNKNKDKEKKILSFDDANDNIKIEKKNNRPNKSKRINSTPFEDLLIQIGNPLKRLKRILSLMKKVIKNIETFLPNNQDSSTYFITDQSQILKREYDYYNKRKLIKKILGEEINERKGSDSNERRKMSEMRNFSLSDLEDNKEKERNPSGHKNNDKEQDNGKETTNTLNEETFECRDENIILIYKRYAKLKNDFFNSKKNLFDISKIPDIYDNIKYDIIHNKDLMNEHSFELFEEISLLANFVMPFEYGITCDEKLNIGLNIIKPLLKKMFTDLIDFNSNFYSNEETIEKDKNWSGLDETNVDENEINTPERHVKSRFYFTCASHMYALLNVIGNGYNSTLTHKNRKSFQKLKKIFDLDYLSHIIFRLFENFNVDLQNPKRFRLEIIMSPGSNKDPREANKNHLIDVSPWILLNKNLNLKEIKEFLNKFI